jgi:cobalamin biosynthesis protein CobD/CbiB
VNKWHLESAAPAEALADHVKCIRQLVQIAVQRQKSHSSQLKVGPFIAESVIKNIEDIEVC